MGGHRSKVTEDRQAPSSSGVPKYRLGLAPGCQGQQGEAINYAHGNRVGVGSEGGVRSVCVHACVSVCWLALRGRINRCDMAAAWSHLPCLSLSKERVCVCVCVCVCVGGGG